MDYLLILYGMFLGVLFAAGAYKQGLLGNAGEGMFNTLKGIFVVIVGAVFGAILAYQGTTVTQESIVGMFLFVTPLGFGTIWFIDIAVTLITNFLQPKSSLAQGMAIRRK